MWVVWLPTVAGLGAAGYGAAQLVKTRQFLERSQRTEGTIVGWRSEQAGSPSDQQTEEYPTVRFRAPDGRVIETETELPLSTRLKVDTPVDVLFNPADPRRARVATHGGRGYLSGTLWVVLGLAFALMPHLFGWW